ncbi:hypothetical protein OSB04_022265 [Centaurea solstitialis]|uniref:ATPase, vacuolar ER assembly factor, Vma12 n=1 Tax=Centaurea solstitialis TaxID=347529 RepID=A0AA38W7H0_9ASTR|nr:hypothetical protein OSB04_022265 [Centaurea solstitialis]
MNTSNSTTTTTTTTTATATATATTTTAAAAAGLIISKTETIQSFLSKSSDDPHLSSELRQIASSLSLQNPPSVPYKPLRSIWVASDPSTRPELSALLSGSQFILNSPQPRQKSEELKARLRKLEEVAERKEYKELVKDITRKAESEPFSSYKDQLGFGLHVALTMFTGYLLGHFTFRALFGHSPIMTAAGGILGLVVGMMVETLLFIIRTSSQDRKNTISISNLKKNQ